MYDKEYPTAHIGIRRYSAASVLLLTDDDGVKEEASAWALQQVSSPNSKVYSHVTRIRQSPSIALVTRQGGASALFSSDAFIEDRVAAGLVSAEDVLVATAVDLMMAKECGGGKAGRACRGLRVHMIGLLLSACLLHGASHAVSYQR